MAGRFQCNRGLSKAQKTDLIWAPGKVVGCPSAVFKQGDWARDRYCAGESCFG